MRDRTYWPRLCLVQVGGEEEAAAVDPLAPGIDLTPLLDLMGDAAVLKVMHAARQDLEIFYRLGRLPVPLFDTQVAAMVCGFGEEVAYDTLVAKLAKAQLDKSSRFTDWARRPLTEAQIRYALGDVTYLRTVYQALKAEIDRRRPHGLGRGGAGPAHQPGQFRAAGDRRLEAAQDPHPRPPVPRHRAGARHLARAGGAAARPAAGAHHPRRPADGGGGEPPGSVEELRKLERVNVDRESAAGVVAAIRRALAIPARSCPGCRSPRRCRAGPGR